jgi:hypothetical protein
VHPHMLAPLLRIRAGNRRLRQNVSHKRTFLHHMGEPGRLKVELSQKNVAKSAPLRYAEHMDNRLVGYARAFVESAVNQIISRRFVKKQQMRWTESGSHHLLQIRTRVLNDEWRTTMARWNPGMIAAA